MHLVEFTHGELSQEKRSQLDSLVNSGLVNGELLVFDFSVIKTVPSETVFYLDSIVEKIRSKFGSEYIILGSSEVLRCFDKSKSAILARSLIQVKEPPVGKAKYLYKSDDDRVFLTLQTSTVEAIQEICFIECICEEIFADDELHRNNKFVAKLIFKLNDTYTVLFSMSEPDLKAFVSIVMGEEIQVLDETMYDWPAEIANHTCNFMKILWGPDLDKRTQTSIPNRLTQSDIDLIRTSKKLVKSFIVENERLDVIVEIFKD